MANLKVDQTPVLDQDGKAQSYPVGTVVMRAVSTIPDGWLVCDGTTKNISDYPELAAHLGFSYGGNGTTTFGLPTLCGQSDVRMPFSTITSEATYPSSFGHAHNVSVTPNSVSGNFSHSHTNNTIATAGETANHGHNNNSNYAGLSNSVGTALRASSTNNTQYLNTVHSHGVNIGDSGTSGYGDFHAHSIDSHTTENIAHNHSVTRGSSNTESGAASVFPPSIQLYFLIKT